MGRNIVLVVMGVLLAACIVGIIILFPYVQKYKDERDAYKEFRVAYEASMQAVKERQPIQDSVKNRLAESVKKTEDKIDREIRDIRNDLNTGKNEIYAADKNDVLGHIRAIDSLLTINGQYPLVID